MGALFRPGERCIGAGRDELDGRPVAAYGSAPGMGRAALTCRLDCAADREVREADASGLAEATFGALPKNETSPGFEARVCPEDLRSGFVEAKREGVEGGVGGAEVEIGLLCRHTGRGGCSKKGTNRGVAETGGHNSEDADMIEFERG